MYTIEIALVADNLGLEEMMMDDAVRHIGNLPQLRSGAGNVDHALRLEEIGLDGGIIGIDKLNPIGDEYVSVNVGIERAEREAPNAGVFPGHWRRLRRALELQLDVFRAGIEQVET